MPEGPVACDCRELPAGIERLWVAGPYDGWLRSAVHDFKFNGETARGQALAELIVGGIQGLDPDATLVPVPMHKKRKRQRGYDQVALLANAVGKATGHSVSDVLIKDRETLTQVGLSRAERSLNLIDAFTVRPDVTVPDRVILIDDVATTGSTLTECAHALLRGGATTISAAVIAHGL
jgi:ComF family protein